MQLGASGIVSRVCLGTMTFGSALAAVEAERLVAEALDLGVSFFDTGNTYGRGEAERILGRAVKAAGRDRAVIATKVYFPTGDGPDDRGLSARAIAKAIDASLTRLRTDHVDLYIVHRWDPLVPIEETLQALDRLVQSGKARAIGASSMAAWQFERALGIQAREGWNPFVCMQGHLNLLYREEEREMLPLCADRGVAYTAWSPLARGWLTGASAPRDALAALYIQGGGETVLRAVKSVAMARGLPMSQVALAWLFRQPGVTGPVLGAATAEHLRGAMEALALDLTPEEMTAIEAPYRPLPVIGYGEAVPPRQ